MMASRKFGYVVAAVVLALLAGCSVTRTTPEKQSYLISVSRTAASSMANGPSIALTTFGVSAPYRNKALVYRTSELGYQSDFYNEYFVAPNQMITDAAATWLASSGKFKSVMRPGTGLDADLLLNGFVTELYGDYRASGQPAAVLAMQFFVTDLRGSNNAVVVSAELKARVIIRDRSAASLVNGLNEGLRQILTDLEAQLGDISNTARTAPAT